MAEQAFRDEIAKVFTALDMDSNDVLDWNECREFVASVMKPLGGYDSNAFKDTYD